MVVCLCFYSWLHDRIRKVRKSVKGILDLSTVLYLIQFTRCLLLAWTLCLGSEVYSLSSFRPQPTLQYINIRKWSSDWAAVPDQRRIWLRVFIPPECLALHPALTSRALQTQLLGRRLLFCFDSETPHGGKKWNIAHLVGNKSLLDDAPVDFQLNQTAPAGDAPLVTLTSHTPARRTLRSRKFDSSPAFLSRLRTFVFF